MGVKQNKEFVDDTMVQRNDQPDNSLSAPQLLVSHRPMASTQKVFLFQDTIYNNYDLINIPIVTKYICEYLNHNTHETNLC